MTDPLPLITKLGKAVANYRAARNRFQRDAALTFMVKRAGELRVARDALTARMDAYDAWRSGQDGPEDEDMIDAYIRDLEAYTTIEDALEDAAHLAWPAEGRKAA